jgi:acyl-CoA synthetase (NDP forming)
VAILGASPRPEKWGHWLARSALKGASRRTVFLVNRNGDEILGHQSYRSLRELPTAVELVVIAIAAAGFEQAVSDALAAGARAIVAITAGLGETGDAGRQVERAVVDRVRAAGAVLVGPNCLGVADTGSELDLAAQDFPPGPLGLISQSGNLALELALLATEAGVGFSRFVSVGNQADLDARELIDAFLDHEPTRAIALYVEDFRDGRALATAAQAAVAAGKPVILLTVGGTTASARAAKSHTGALVSDRVAIDAACQASGMLRVDTPTELIDLAQAVLMPHPMRGRRLSVFGDGGGHIALAADLLIANGLELPPHTEPLATALAAALPATAATRNPVDMAGGGEQDFFNFERMVRLLAQSGESDAVLLTGYFGGYSELSEEFRRTETEVAQAMARAADENGRPLIVQTMYPASPPAKALRRAHVPVYGDIAAVARALGRLARRLQDPPTSVPVLPRPATGQLPRVGYFEARQLVAAAGIRLIEARRVTTLDDARTAGRELGFPLVLKALGPAHKSDAGGIRVGISSEHELETAFTEMAARVAAKEFSVERVAPLSQGVELLIGVRRERSFGPIALVGMGGVYAEVFADVAAALAPVTEPVAQRLIRSMRSASLLLGTRGRPPLDIQAAASALAALSRFASERPDISEIEVNPLLVLPDQAVALDARFVLSEHPGPPVGQPA